MKQQSYAYFSSALKDKRKPCAFVDMDAFDANLLKSIQRSAGKQIRVASKSIRAEYLLRYLLKQSEKMIGIMCFTAEEAHYLFKKGFNNLLIGYPTVSEKQLSKLANVVRKGAEIYLMADSKTHFERYNKIAKEHHVFFSVCIDIDMSVDFPALHFGVYRSPITHMNALQKLVENFDQYENLKIEALMGYEAQIAGLGDQIEGQQIKSAAIRLLKRKSLPKIAQFRKEAVAYLQSKGHVLKIVNGGGTGSMESTCKEECVSEVTVGSAFFNSHLFDDYEAFQYEAAAGFAVEVVREPKEGMVTALGGGYTASGEATAAKLPQIWFPESCSLTKNEGTGEVQTPILLNGQKLNTGDTVFFRHSKAGELCERFNKLHLIRNGKVIKSIKTYRGKGKAFL